MFSIQLTRKEYDGLLDSNPQWVRDNWESMGRQWGYGGVQVTCSESQLVVIAGYLSRAR